MSNQDSESISSNEASCDLFNLGNSHEHNVFVIWHNFINELNVIKKYIVFNTIENEEFSLLTNKEINDIKNCCNAFNESIVNEDIFNLFIKKKIRVFSHKTEITKKLSQSLFGDNITLRDLLNEKNNKIKNIIWCSFPQNN